MNKQVNRADHVSKPVKHTELFYRAIARIKAIEAKHGIVLVTRLSSVYNLDPVRSFDLWEELGKAGIITDWDSAFHRHKTKANKTKGNIGWKSIKKYKVPRKIQIQEIARVVDEQKKGLFPKTIGDLK